MADLSRTQEDTLGHGLHGRTNRYGCLYYLIFCRGFVHARHGLIDVKFSYTIMRSLRSPLPTYVILIDVSPKWSVKLRTLLINSVHSENVMKGPTIYIVSSLC